jgi:hypothetical protein
MIYLLNLLACYQFIIYQVISLSFYQVISWKLEEDDNAGLSDEHIS